MTSIEAIGLLQAVANVEKNDKIKIRAETRISNLIFNNIQYYIHYVQHYVSFAVLKINCKHFNFQVALKDIK